MHLAGNILVKKGACGDHELVPIDHGYVLPDSFQDISFEWLYWPQARAPLGERIGTCHNYMQIAIVLIADGFHMLCEVAAWSCMVCHLPFHVHIRMFCSVFSY